MPTADNNGVVISYRTAGDDSVGTSALLIHGLGANMAYWHPLLVKRLGQLNRLVMFDLRGHGYSSQPARRYNSADMASDALAVLDNLAIADCELVAHSFGVAVALQLLRMAPDRFHSLVVLDGRVRLLQPVQRLKDWQHFAKWWPHFEAAGVKIEEDQELDFSLLTLVAEERFAEARKSLEADGFFVPFGLWNGGRRTAAKWRRLISETTAMDDFKQPAGLSIEALSRIRQPMFALYGEFSHCLPTRDGLLRAIPDCQCDTLPGVGHNFPLLKPEETADRIAAFWAACESSRNVT